MLQKEDPISQVLKQSFSSVHAVLLIQMNMHNFPHVAVR